MMIGFDIAQTMEFRVRYQFTPLTAETATDNDARLLGWNRHCFTWKANDKIKVCIHDDHVIPSADGLCEKLLRKKHKCFRIMICL